MGEPSVTGLDRELQRKLLVCLARRFPAPCGEDDFGNLAGGPGFLRNLVYLGGHGLVQLETFQTLDSEVHLKLARITASGMDFLQDDGGLTAILGVVTVKLHDDTIRQLLMDRVEASDAEPSVKASLKKTIRELPAEGLKSATLALLQQGLLRMPNAIHMIQNALGSS